MWRNGNPRILPVGIKMVQKTAWRFHKKLSIQFPCDPAIPLLGINLREMKKTYVQTKTCIQRFVAMFFIIAKK